MEAGAGGDGRWPPMDTESTIPDEQSTSSTIPDGPDGPRDKWP